MELAGERGQTAKGGERSSRAVLLLCVSIFLSQHCLDALNMPSFFNEEDQILPL
jgi:hypothetical protein